MATKRRTAQPIDDVDIASVLGNDEIPGDVTLSVQTLENGSRDSVFWPAQLGKLSGEAREVVSAIEHVVIARQRLLRELDGLVEELRSYGASWTVVGWCTGMTQQAAHKRWSTS
jgi:hypothetical protein